MSLAHAANQASLLRWYGLARSFDPKRSTEQLIRDPTRTLRYARKALRGNRRYGRLLESVSGTTPRRPFRHYWGLFRRFGHTIDDYYRYRLHDLASDLEAAAFLCERPLVLLREGAYKHLGVEFRRLLDKARFADTCREHRLPVIPTIAEIEQGRVIWGQGGVDQGLPAADLITKPRDGMWGEGVCRWSWESCAYVNPRGERLSSDSLLDRLSEESRNSPMMVQPRMQNAEPLSSLVDGGLCTVRIVTSRSCDGAPEPQVATLKMPTGSKVVDNFANDGIAAPVEIESGNVGPAVSKSVEAMIRRESFTHHPDTRRPIAGLRLPAWRQTLDLCLEAHRRFPEFQSIGWDVAIAIDGPVLVEGNHGWDPIVVQQPGLNPLGNTKLIDHMISFFGNRVDAVDATHASS